MEGDNDMKDYTAMASCIFDGGYRASDKDDLMILFRIFDAEEGNTVSEEETEEDLDNICELLAEYERR